MVVDTGTIDATLFPAMHTGIVAAPVLVLTKVSVGLPLWELSSRPCPKAEEVTVPLS